MSSGQFQCHNILSLESELGVITSLCVQSAKNNLFVGTDIGLIILYRLKRVRSKNFLTSFEAMKKKLVGLGDGRIEEIDYIDGDFNVIVVRTRSKVIFLDQKNLSEYHVLKYNTRTLISFSVCNGYPFYGVCIGKSNCLEIFNLSLGFDVCKRITLTSSPKMVKWSGDYICTFINSEYFLVDTITNGMMNLYRPKSRTKVAEVIHCDDILIADIKSVIYIESDGNIRRFVHQFEKRPLELSFCFPFMFTLNEQMNFEIRSIVELSFHQKIDNYVTSDTSVIKFSSDGIVNLASFDSKVVLLRNTNSNYLISDRDILKNVIHDKNNTELFIRYLNEIIRDIGNPFSILLLQYVENFFTLFPDPDDVEISEVKMAIDSSINKIHSFIRTYFSRRFRHIQNWENLAKSVILTVFYSRIYYHVLAIISIGCKEKNREYWEMIQTKKHSDFMSFNIRKRFWLCEESLSDKPPTLSQWVDPPFLSKESDGFLPFGVLKSMNTSPIFGRIGSNSPNAEKFFIPPEEIEKDVIFYSIEDISAEMFQLLDPLGMQSKSLGPGIITTQDNTLLFVCLDEKQIKIIPESTETYFSKKENSFSWRQSGFHFKIIIDDEHDGVLDKIQNNLLDYHSQDKEKFDIDPTDFFESMSEEIIYDSNSHDTDIEITSEITKIVSEDSLVRRESTVFTIEEIRDSFSFQQRIPYKKAILTLQNVTTMNSPRDKMACILQALQDSIICIREFWLEHDCVAVVGADDLVPIFNYIVLKAEIPNLISQVNFIEHFADEDDLHGKYGYALATLQISVGALKHL